MSDSKFFRSHELNHETPFNPDFRVDNLDETTEENLADVPYRKEPVNPLEEGLLKTIQTVNRLVNKDLAFEELMIKREIQFDKFTTEGRKLFLQKNREYMDAIAECGLLGAAVEIISLGRRLRALVLKAEGHGRFNKSTLTKVIPDIQVYGAILQMMLEDENWDGE